MTTRSDLDLERTALLLVDLQNDFIHPEGAYARGGATAAEIAALPDRLAPLATAARQAGLPVIATLFTLVPGPDGRCGNGCRDRTGGSRRLIRRKLRGIAGTARASLVSPRR